MVNKRWITLPPLSSFFCLKSGFFFAILKDFKFAYSPFTVPANSKSFKIAQKPAFGEKWRQYTADKVIQRLFNIDL